MDWHGMLIANDKYMQGDRYKKRLAFFSKAYHDSKKAAFESGLSQQQAAEHGREESKRAGAAFDEAWPAV